MGTVGYGRLKHANGESRDDAEGDTAPLKTVLQPGEAPRRPKEGDTVLVRQALLLHLALKALDRAIADYCGGAGRRRPSYAALAQYLDEREREAQPLPARVTRVPG
jgi:hypothetical protein